MLPYVSGIFRSKRSGFLFLSVIVLSIKIKSINVRSLLELEKCPACYGLSACDFARDVELDIREPGTLISYFTGTRNVFQGTLGDNRLVIKKLGSSAELEALDREICWGKSDQQCTVDVNASDEDLLALIEERVSLEFEEDHLSRLRICPSTKRLESFLNRAFVHPRSFHEKRSLFNVWTIVSLNPEPILLQILSADHEWPVPKYFGACGRVVLEEYIGLPLADYYYAAWPVRLKIASSLLNAAYKFTFKDESFGFYLTDVSEYNTAVDSNGAAVFVDLENVIVVDRNISKAEQPVGWEELHVNDRNDAKNLIFSSEDICGHKVSDHNYYAICQLIAETGLLRDAEMSAPGEYRQVNNLIENCLIPRSDDRISAGIQLETLLNKVINGV